MGPRIILLFIIALSMAANAAVVGPKVYEQKDMGDISLDEFVYSLSADCTAATITVTVMDGNGAPVRDANTYLKYVDFTSQLLSTAKTDQDGNALLKLPGNVQLMRGLFILVIEKYGYKNKEVHFDLSPCYAPAKQNTTTPTQPPKNNTQNQTQPPPTQPPQNATNPPAQNGTKPPAQNQTAGNNSGQNATNETQNPKPGTQNLPQNLPQICPAVAIIAAIACAALLFFRGRRRTYKMFKR